jgi:8-oxo-dGTP pyrophosphatase MutT (NUDIX family)
VIAPGESSHPDKNPIKNKEFDASQHPVMGVDSHLPFVSPDKLQVNYLREVFKKPLNGLPESFGDYSRLDSRIDPSQQVPASVLFGIVERSKPSVLLTQRSAKLRKHSGQIAFAGGRVDREDASEVETALREAKEEIGLDSHFVEIMGVMPKYLTGTGYLVTPVVGLISPHMSLELNEHEVTEVFEVPLEFLMNPAHHRRHSRELDGRSREWFSMPYKDAEQERFIWGVTAGIIRNFYHFLIKN